MVKFEEMKAEGRRQKAEPRTTRRASFLPSAFCLLPSAFIFFLLATAPLHAQRARAVRSHPLDTPASWLRHRAIALDDTERLVRLTQHAQVVALGDVTHGTHETYAARLAIIPRLIDSGGFRIIAIEGPYAQYAALDDYLRTGDGDPAALLRNDPYYFWNTQEMLDLILWARARNANGITPPIRIAGVDGTEPAAVARRVIAMLKTIDAELAAFAELQYGCLPRCNATINEVRARIETRRALFASDTDFDETVHAARVVEQGVEVAKDLLANRDAVMAENALWLAARAKVLLIGHNEHWSRIDYRLADINRRSTGHDLADALGSGYFAIGSVVRDGSFYAVMTDVLPLRIGVNPIDPPVHDDWALVLDEAGLTSVLFALFAPVPDWLAGTRRIRFAGSGRPMQITPAQSLAAKFDAVLYVRTSTPSQLLYFPTF